MGKKDFTRIYIFCKEQLNDEPYMKVEISKQCGKYYDNIVYDAVLVYMNNNKFPWWTPAETFDFLDKKYHFYFTVKPRKISHGKPVIKQNKYYEYDILRKNKSICASGFSIIKGKIKYKSYIFNSDQYDHGPTQYDGKYYLSDLECKIVKYTFQMWKRGLKGKKYFKIASALDDILSGHNRTESTLVVNSPTIPKISIDFDQYMSKNIYWVAATWVGKPTLQRQRINLRTAIKSTKLNYILEISHAHKKGKIINNIKLKDVKNLEWNHENSCIIPSLPQKPIYVITFQHRWHYYYIAHYNFPSIRDLYCNVFKYITKKNIIFDDIKFKEPPIVSIKKTFNMDDDEMTALIQQVTKYEIQIELNQKNDELLKYIDTMNIESLKSEIRNKEETIGLYIEHIKGKRKIIKNLYSQYKQKIDILKKEDNRLETNHKMNIVNKNMKQIVLLGKTGHGKSTFGNRLCGVFDDNKGIFKSSYDPDSITKDIQKEYSKKLDATVVDTPGVFDSDEEDFFHANKLINYLKGSGGINAFIIINKPGRFDSNFQFMLKDLSRKLTPKYWKHVIFVFTHIKDNYRDNWDKGNDSYKEKFLMRITTQFKLDFDPPIFGVDNMNKSNVNDIINKIATKIPKKKFNCESLVSPIEQLKIEAKKIEKEILDESKGYKKYLNAIYQASCSLKNANKAMEQKITGWRPSNFLAKLYAKWNAMFVIDLKLFDFTHVGNYTNDDNNENNDNDYDDGKFDDDIKTEFVTKLNDIKSESRSVTPRLTPRMTPNQRPKSSRNADYRKQLKTLKSLGLNMNDDGLKKILRDNNGNIDRALQSIFND